MRLYKRNGWYWTDFSIDGQRYRKPLETRNWQEALHKEREAIEAAEKGLMDSRSAKKPKRLLEAIEAYLEHKKNKCSPRTLELEEERLSIVRKHFGDGRLTTISPEAIEAYQSKRQQAGIGNRTINMDIGVLRRVLKYTGHWRKLQNRIEFLAEGDGDPKGRPLTVEEQSRLFDNAAGNPEWEHVYCAAVLATNTSMRGVEVKHLRWKNVDLFERTVKIERSKNKESHRVIPLNGPAFGALVRMRQRAEKLNISHPEHYIWPACQHHRLDPTRPQKSWHNAWRSLRNKANLEGLRFHDLRFTAITGLAEMGVPDYVLQSITGHLSRKMLDYYSRIRLDAKRNVLEKLAALQEPTTTKQPEEASHVQ